MKSRAVFLVAALFPAVASAQVTSSGTPFDQLQQQVLRLEALVSAEVQSRATLQANYEATLAAARAEMAQLRSDLAAEVARRGSEDAALRSGLETQVAALTATNSALRSDVLALTASLQNATSQIQQLHATQGTALATLYGINSISASTSSAQTDLVYAQYLSLWQAINGYSVEASTQAMDHIASATSTIRTALTDLLTFDPSRASVYEVLAAQLPSDADMNPMRSALDVARESLQSLGITIFRNSRDYSSSCEGITSRECGAYGAFQEMDQKTNQLMNLMSQVLKTMNDSIMGCGSGICGMM